MKHLAISIPTYNEKENISKLIHKIKEETTGLDLHVTIIFIDDNSPDGTGEIVQELSQKYDKNPFTVTGIHRKGKLGLGTAYIDAFKKVIKEKYDYVLTMDADLSHQPKYIRTHLKHIQDYDMVIASRNVKGGRVEGWSILRHVISKGGSLYTKMILGVNIKDFTSGFIMMKRKVLEALDLDKIKSTGFSFLFELKYKVVKNGFSYFEFPIVFPNRLYGEAKMSKKIFIEGFLRVWQIRFSK